LRSLGRVFFAQRASVFPDHTDLFAAKASLLNRHAEEHIFVLLIIGGKGVLVNQHQFRVIRARFRELRKLLSDGRDQAGLSLHALVVGHRAMRIADPESGRIPQVESTLSELSLSDFRLLFSPRREMVSQYTFEPSRFAPTSGTIYSVGCSLGNEFTTETQSLSFFRYMLPCQSIMALPWKTVFAFVLLATSMSTVGV